MTKANWIDILIDNLAGGDCPRELKGIYHPAIIEKYLELAFDSLFNSNNGSREALMDELGTTNWKYDVMSKPYLMDVNYDSTRDKYYSSLPVGVMSIDNNSGIRLIYPVKSEQSAFIPRALTDNFLMGGLDVNNFIDIVRFTVESNQKVYYSGNADLLCRLHKLNEKVYAKLAVKFSALEMTDEVTVPDGKNDEIFQSVWNFMIRKKPEDLTNDTTPNQPQA